MRVYKLTKLGQRAIDHGHAGDNEEGRILNFIANHKDATLSELEVVGDRWRIEKLKGEGIIQELTT